VAAARPDFCICSKVFLLDPGRRAGRAWKHPKWAARASPRARDRGRPPLHPEEWVLSTQAIPTTQLSRKAVLRGPGMWGPRRTEMDKKVALDQERMRLRKAAARSGPGYREVSIPQDGIDPAVNFASRVAFLGPDGPPPRASVGPGGMGRPPPSGRVESASSASPVTRVSWPAWCW